MKKVLHILKHRKEFVFYSIIRLLILALGLISNIIIIRKLAVAEYGVFSVALMLLGLMTTFGFSWSSSSIQYFGCKEKEKTGSLNKTFWARNIIIIINLLIVVIIFFVFETRINIYIGVDVAKLVLVWLLFSVIEDYLSYYFLTVKKQVVSCYLTLTAKVIYLVLILFLSFDIKELIIMNIFSQATVVLYLFKINKEDVGKFEFDYNWFKQILNFSLWQLFGFSGLYLINFGDTAIIKYFMSTEDIGIYNAAYKLFANISGFSYIITSYYASSITLYFANKKSDELSKFFYKERYLILIISIVIHILIMIFSKSIIGILFGTRYIQSVLIFNILMVGSIFRYINVFYILYYNTNNQYRLQQLVNICRAVINVVLDIILIKVFGLIGPAIATTVAIIVTTVFSMIYCENKIKGLCM